MDQREDVAKRDEAEEAVEEPEQRPPLRLGILGAAAIAPAVVLVPARARSDLSIGCIAARDQSRAQEMADRWGIPQVVSSYEEVLASPEVDAVYIPLPNGLHGVWTQRAIAAGKHVLCEKPFTANMAEAERVRDAAREAPELVVMEAFHWRYHPSALRVIELLEQGAIGTVQRIDASFCVPLTSSTDIRWDLGLAGGALMDVGCYPLHMWRTFSGAEPTVVAASALERSPGVDRAMSVELQADGVRGTVTCSMWSKRVLSIWVKITGSTGELHIRNPVLPHLGGRIQVRQRSALGVRTVRTERVSRRTSYEFQMDAFLEAIATGSPVPTGPDDSVRTMALIDACYRAAGLAPREPTQNKMSVSR